MGARRDVVGVQIPVTSTQLELLDRIVREGAYGQGRGEALSAVVLEHAGHVLRGEPVPASSRRQPIEVDRPLYGPLQQELRLEPVTGKALPLLRGEVLRIIQLEGGQCVDFNGYHLHDYKEALDCGYTRQKAVHTGTGTVLWTGSPRARPIYLILDCAETCDQYYGGHRCNAIRQEIDLGLLDHPNCQDTFAEAIREYGLTPDDTHDAYNFWMAAGHDGKGRRSSPWNRGRKGDYVDLLALFDTLSVPIICGGDLSTINSFTLAPVQLQVFSASEETLRLCDLMAERYGRCTSQLTATDFKAKEILARRELYPDPGYRPDYLPAPAKGILEVEVSGAVRSTLQELLATGEYGATPEKAAIVAMVRWYTATRGGESAPKLRVRYPVQS